MLEVLGETVDSDVSGVFVLVLAMAIFSIYRVFCRAYKAILGNLTLRFTRRSDEQVEIAQTVCNTGFTGPSCSTESTQWAVEHCIEQPQKEEQLVGSHGRL